MFQDDLLNGSASLEHAREVNIRVNCLMKERGLNLNKDKSVCMAIGSKKQKSEIAKALKESPLMCSDFETKEVEEEKWLGQIISASGLAESDSKTVDARIGKVKGAVLEIAQIVNDYRVQVVGGMETAILLWETQFHTILVSAFGPPGGSWGP